MSGDWIVPDWPAPRTVRALVTTRRGGTSSGPYSSMNLGLHVGDDPAAVARNRALLRRRLPSEPVWLEQVHGTAVVDADGAVDEPPRADASVAKRTGRVCLVMTADCLPLLLCNEQGSVVAAVHAGWRGLADGIVEATLARLGVVPQDVLAWLGPAIGPDAFELGDEVRQRFVAAHAGDAAAFRPATARGKWMGDLFALARLRLARAGVQRVFGGGLCTHAGAERFYSYRREGITGRFASMVWLSR